MTTDTIGGVWSYTLDLLRALASQDIEAVVVSQGHKPTPEQVSDVSGIPGVTLIVTELRLEWMSDPWDDVRRCGDLLLGIERDFCANIVHLNGYSHAALPFRAPKVVVAHSCVLSWWRAVHGEPAPEREWAQYKSEVQAGLNGADLVIAPTQAMLDVLADEYIFNTPTSVIYNGCDAKEAGCSGGEGRKSVFCAGRIWDEAKNISKLAEATSEINAEVIIAGEQTQGDAAAHIAESANLQLPGHLDRAEVTKRMEKAAIYCLPALYEPFGLSVLEAAYAGCALVLGDIGTLRELWGDDCARFVNPRDARCISDAVNEILADDILRACLQKSAQKRAARYTSSVMAANYLQAYHFLLSS